MATPLPQLVLLYVVGRLGRASIVDVATVMYYLKREGVATGYNFVKLSGVAISKDIQLDLNLLKVLGLIREEDGGVYSVTEKGKVVIQKMVRDPSYRSLIKTVEHVLSNVGRAKKVQGQS
ncbi:MAG: hypothetical protein GXO32_08695 [Crenarchaeota archaeon]|nr:hypothetical protein [Thermoproteota archaeon]